MYNYGVIGGKEYTYEPTITGEYAIYADKKLVAKVDNFREAKEWLDELDKEVSSVSKNNGTEV